MSSSSAIDNYKPVRIADGYYFYACPACLALVRQRDVDGHDEWHAKQQALADAQAQVADAMVQALGAALPHTPQLAQAIAELREAQP